MRLNKPKFLAWLQAKRPEEVVGQNKDCHTCPVAKYYRDVTGGAEIVVFSDPNWGDYKVDRGGGARRAPAWAENFFRAVDGRPSANITAADAIAILAGC